MRYGQNYTLKYISKEKSKIVFDVIDENGTNLVLMGTMQDLQNVLKFSASLSADMDFNALQDAILKNPVPFIAKRRKLKSMDELDFNL